MIVKLCLYNLFSVLILIVIHKLCVFSIHVDNLFQNNLFCTYISDTNLYLILVTYINLLFQESYLVLKLNFGDKLFPDIFQLFLYFYVKK